MQAALDDGYEVDVVAMRQAGEAPCEAHGGLRVVRLPVSHRRGRALVGFVFEYLSFTALASLRVASLALQKRYAAVQVNNPPDFLIVAALAPKLLGARVIFDVHDLSPDMFAMRFSGRWGARTFDRALRLVERWAARLADVVITVHEPYRRELVARGVPADKITVVMNSVDERLLPNRAGVRLRPSGFRVVYHGTLTPHYGVNLLVEAAARLRPEIPDLRLEIYGQGDALGPLKARVAELGIAERVFFSDSYLPHAEVLALVDRADVGVIPNLPLALNRFALSSKLFEYVALGVPVVSADLPTIRDHFSDDELVFFRAGDANALAAAIVDVFRHPDVAAARARAALRRYDAYRWPLQAKRYVDALNGLPQA